MRSRGSVNGHTFGTLVFNGGNFILDAQAPAENGASSAATATRRALAAGSSRQAATAQQTAIRRVLGGGNVTQLVEVSAAPIARIGPRGQVLVRATATAAAVRRVLTAGNVDLSSLMSVVMRWRYLRPTEWKRIAFVMDRREAVVLAERRTIRLTSSGRTIRVPPERDL